MKNHSSCGHHYQKIKFGYYFKFQKYESGPWRWLCGENACCMNILRTWLLVDRRTTCHPVHSKQRHKSLVKASYSAYQKGWALGSGRDSDHMGGTLSGAYPVTSWGLHMYTHIFIHMHTYSSTYLQTYVYLYIRKLLSTYININACACICVKG